MRRKLDENKTVCAPDELGLHRVVERHEHLGVLADLTHHVLQSHKEGERWSGGELRLPGQIDILLLRLRGGERRGGQRVNSQYGHHSSIAVRLMQVERVRE